jgi:O-antigen/teichoic acid export membrane protein
VPRRGSGVLTSESPSGVGHAEAVRGRNLVKLAAKLGALNWLSLAAGFITGPILARNLGASGRGELAAILVPAGLATIVVGFGLSAYASREAARGIPLGVLGGSVGALGVVLGMAGFAASIPLAVFLADGNGDVRLMLLLFFAVLPLNLIAQMLYGTAVGLGQYRAMTISRLTPPFVAAIALPVLALLGKLTVVSAALATMGAGLLSLAPLLAIGRSMLPLRFDLAIARASLSYGMRAWGAGVSAAANSRLDQLIMVKLVSSSQLGQYAVAVTVAALIPSAVSSVTSLLLPRVARGDGDLVKRSLRVMVMVVLGFAGAAALATPIVIPWLFGEQFRGAVSMAVILLAGSIPFAAASHLATGLAAMGFPGVESMGQTTALIVTVIGLPLAIPALGGDGAALVSTIAYTVNLAVLLYVARRRMGGSLMSYLVVTRADLRWLVSLRARAETAPAIA